MDGIKLNIGPSPIWQKEGWHTLDHKPLEQKETAIHGDASNIPLDPESCSTVFMGHVIEHIPHFRLEDILLEINRVLKQDGILRILSPDLYVIAKAYVEKDMAFFKKAIEEDENIRTDLGIGGSFMNFVVSPGQDTALFNRQLTEFIAGYAHLYLYDFEMLKILLERCGFYNVTRKGFCESDVADYREPLHVVGLEPKWQDLNQEFYKKHNLIHKYDDAEGRYIINFKITGFDRDPLTSLIVEAKKHVNVNKNEFKRAYQDRNYGKSLLHDKSFSLKCNLIKAISSTVDSSQVVM